MVQCQGPSPRNYEEESVKKSMEGEDARETEIILIETSSTHLLDGYERILSLDAEPRLTILGKAFPAFFVPLFLFFFFLSGFLCCIFYVSTASDLADNVVGSPLEIDPPWWRKSSKKNPSDVSPGSCSNVRVKARIDCFPDGAGSQSAEQQCLSRGCCWSPVTEPSHPHNLIPWCFFPPNRTFYYVQDSRPTHNGIAISLTLASPEDPKTRYLPDVVKNVLVELINYGKNTARIRITDAENARFEVPNLRLPTFDRETSSSPPFQTKEEPDFAFEVGNFSVVVRRRCDGVAVFDSRTLAPLIFADQFLQLTTTLPGNKVFGLGEHRTGSPLWDVEWTRVGFWAADHPPTEDSNLYGVHPVMMTLEDGSKSDGDYRASGIFLLNSNAMEAILQPNPAVTFRTIGGILDFFVYTGPSAGDVMAAHWDVVGRPLAPPNWALGFHLCRWGYETDKDLENQIKKMLSGNFPYTTQWNDIDYMHERLDFTVDQQRYLNLSNIIRSLHTKRQRYVMILDPGISNSQPKGDYSPYDDGLNRGVFVKDHQGLPIVGKVWPGTTVFPDFTSLGTNLWWKKNLGDLMSKIDFDGVWIDMNEPSNFVHGSTAGCDYGSQLDFPYYVPTALVGGARKSNPYNDTRLFYKTLCPSAQHRMGKHFDLHSMYGLFEMRATHDAMLSLKPSDRPLIISRSTFPFAGQFGGHWLGDNSATWVDLQASITGILNFNFFGIPLVGADICGFNGNTNPELCVRWMQLGSFYPFMRNHNSLEATPQDPASFTAPAVRVALRRALWLRYKNVPYFYSRLLQATLNGTIPVRPMFVDFLNEPLTWNLSSQFMWGNEMMITPVLEKGKVQVDAYFPVGIWYDWVSNVTVRIAPPQGRFVSNLPAPLNHIPAWIRGGKTIVQRIPDFQNNLPLEGKLRIIIALDEFQESSGEFLWDDEGDSVNSVHTSADSSSSPSSGSGGSSSGRSNNNNAGDDDNHNSNNDLLATSSSSITTLTAGLSSWHVRISFSWRNGVFSNAIRYEWGDIDNAKDSKRKRERALDFLRRKLKVGEVLVLGLRNSEETRSLFFLDIRRNDNEREEEEEVVVAERSKKILNWEKHYEDGILIKVERELDLTTQFRISRKKSKEETTP